jgi:hypothetical protein
MKSVLLILLLLSAPLTGWSAQAGTLFGEAKILAKTEPEKARKLFQLSALEFEKMAAENPALSAIALYNAGNAHFFAEERGRALYAYRRAQVLRPLNRELQQNIDWLTELSGTATSVPKISFLKKASVLLSLRMRVMLILLLWIVGVTVALNWQWRSKANRAVLISLGSLAGILTLSVVITLTSGPQHGIVLSHQAEARKGDGYLYEPAFAAPLPEATEFSIVKITPDWVQIKLDDGNAAWLPAADIGLW